MALSRVKVWGAERLYASDLNAEFNNIINNAASLLSPLSAGLDWDGYAHTLDAAGVTTAQSTAATAWSFQPGNKTGTPGTTGSISNWASNTVTDSNTAGSGTATTWTGHAFHRPTLAAQNALVVTTNAATVYIQNAPLAGSNETITNPWALWVDDGNVRIDGSLAAGTVASYSSTDTLASPVGLALLSGASFIFSLPPVANHVNREAMIWHQGTSLTQVYTIKGNGSENIIAIDGTANTYLLYTAGERVRLKSDGTSWYVVSHEAQTEWANVGAMIITGTSANPTKPSSPDVDKLYWRRQGNTAFIRYILQISSAAGSAAGTGNYVFTLPTNILFDTTIMTPYSSALTAATRSEASESYVSGNGLVTLDSVSALNTKFYAHSTSEFKVMGTLTTDAAGADLLIVGSTAYPLTNAEMAYEFHLDFRAANWRL